MPSISPESPDPPALLNEPRPRRRLTWLGIAGWCCLLLAMALVAFAVTPSKRSEAASRGWHTSLSDGLAAARVSGKPLLLDFTADWCEGCQIMQRDVFPDPDVARVLFARFEPVRIDVTTPDPSDDLPDRMGIEYLPALVVIAPDGREVARREGASRPEAFARWLEKAAKTYRHAAAAEPAATQPAAP